MSTFLWFGANFMLLVIYVRLHYHFRGRGNKKAVKWTNTVYIIILLFFVYVRMVQPLAVTSVEKPDTIPHNQEFTVIVEGHNKLPVELTFDSSLAASNVLTFEDLDIKKVRINNADLLTNDQNPQPVYTLKGWQPFKIELRMTAHKTPPTYLDLAFKRLGDEETYRINLLAR